MVYFIIEIILLKIHYQNTIKYRNVYNRTKLNQQRYFMVNDKFMDTQIAIAYGNKFSHFEYKWSVN